MKHATVKGATGVKIVGRDDLEKALAGLPLYVARRDDEVEYFKDLLERKRIKNSLIRPGSVKVRSAYRSKIVLSIMGQLSDESLIVEFHFDAK